MNRYRVCVYGAASENIDVTYKTDTESLGYALGKNNFTLVFGAGSTGLMGAVARGVSRANGEIIGVAPHFMSEFESLYTDCTQLIYTESMAERKSIMEFSADAFIITPGGIGTMDEFFQILTLKQLNRQIKPIVIFNVGGFYDSLINLIDEYIEKRVIGENIRDKFVVCNDIDSTIDYLKVMRSAII